MFKTKEAVIEAAEEILEGLDERKITCAIS